MKFDITKKRLLTIKIVTCIIINFLKLKNIHYSIMSSNLINKLTIVKDLTKMTYDIMTCNFIPVIFNTLPMYMKFKKIFKKMNKNKDKDKDEHEDITDY